MIFKNFLTKTECLSFSLLAIYPYNLGQWEKKIWKIHSILYFQVVKHLVSLLTKSVTFSQHVVQTEQCFCFC